MPEETREALSRAELEEAWPLLAGGDRALGLNILPRDEAEELFFSLAAREQAELILALPHGRRSWLRLLPPDDAADLIQEAPPDKRQTLLELLDDVTRTEVTALLAYAEDDAGGLMNPRFARVRPDMTVDQAISYLRRQAIERVETIYYAYVLDEQQRLQGVVSFRQLFAAAPDKLVRDVMQRDLVVAHEGQDQESVSRVFAAHNLMAIPVVDAERRMKGIITIDDIVDVVQEEATEDIQKIGGTEALEAPYLRVGFLQMVKKRAVWLSVLFVSEMLTTIAMARYEDEIARAVVLALFIPLIISSGGNSGSQASTLVVRAIALGEVRLRDWFQVVRRELLTGITLGGILAAVGVVRVLVGQALFHTFGEHYVRVALTVGASVVGVVTLGTLAGSQLPLLLSKLKLDPASASAPFVATIVDVTGLVIYFTVASLILGGTLL